MILKLSSPALTLVSVFGAVLVAPCTSRQIAKSVNFAKDPADSPPQGFNGDTPPNEEQECSFNKSFKVGEASADADIGIFGCGKDGYCVEDPASSLGGRCINLDVDHEQDFEEMLAVESHRRLAGISCTYSDGITKGFKCLGFQACDDGNLPVINVTDVGCGSCNGDYACYFFAGYRKITVEERSCVGDYSCYNNFDSDVGVNACNGLKACYNLWDRVPDIGDCQCNGDKKCYEPDTKAWDKSADICHTGSPTSSPTKSPSKSPSSSPTASPSSAPSKTPTESPSYSTTKSPSKSPSSLPMVSPSLSPSKTPTGSPWSSPTSSPLSVPSKSPSKSLSSSPVSEGCFPLARKVKVQSLTGVPIQMFELQVISRGLNVAIGKDASQSSDFKGKAMFAASKAVDDNESSFSHTGRSGCGVWWEVDLGESYPVESIKILNRWCQAKEDPTGCLCKLSHAAISLLDDDGKWLDATLTGNTCDTLEVEHEFEASPVHCV